MNQYEVALEVAGPAAMFARPDTGGTPTSYSAPTWSAVQLNLCVAPRAGAWIETRVFR